MKGLNELVMNNFENKKNLVKIFITSLLLGGETFGVGKLRRRTVKKNRHNSLSESDFKKYISKRMRKIPGSKKKGAKKKKSKRGIAGLNKNNHQNHHDLNNLLNKVRKSNPRDPELRLEQQYLEEEIEFQKEYPMDIEFLNKQVHQYLGKL